MLRRGHGLPRWSAPAIGLCLALALAAPAGAAVLANYQLQSTLASSGVTAPALTNIGTLNTFGFDSVGGHVRHVLDFPAAGGVQSTVTMMPTSSYTIFLTARLSTVTGYRRILDMRGGTTDDGVYDHDGKLDIFIGGNDHESASTDLTAGQFAQIAISRSAGAGNIISAFVDGALAASTGDNGALAPGGIRLFKDDVAEESAGALACLRVYDTVLSPTDESSLAADPETCGIAGDSVYSFTGSEQSFSVPPDVASLHVAATAGLGAGFLGGQAGTAAADLAVTPGETLFAEVGGAGGGAFGAGFNGGGLEEGGGARAGGASDVRRVSSAGDAGASLASRVIVAGGGGGAGTTAGSTGGAGGGSTGTDGTGDGLGGKGGTQSAGGAAGTGGLGTGMAGTLGQGGDAADAGPDLAGGGGGGGYYGGGAGDHDGDDVSAPLEGGGGGGGSGHFGVGTSNGVFGTSPLNDPMIDFTWTPKPPITITAPVAGGSYGPGAAVAAQYACAPPDLARLDACTGSVANGAALDTSTLGTHSFTVDASATDGRLTPFTNEQTVTYTVAAPPPGQNPPGQTPPGQNPPGHNPPPVVAPVLSGVTQSASRWSLGSTLPKASRAKKPPVGTTFHFKLDKAARVTFAFARKTTGRLVKKSCVALTRSNRKAAHCTRSLAAGSLTVSGHAGANTLRFAGRLSRSKKLVRGAYALKVTATVAGKASTPRALAFTIA
jgi:hypothetical protein